MQANDMKFNFQLKYDSLFDFSAPAYDDRQISWLLTTAQNRIFIDKYYAPSDKVQKGFEGDEKRRRDLEQLIKQAKYPADAGADASETITVSTAQLGVHPNGKFFDLPAGFLYAIEETAVTSEIATKEVPVKPVTHDQYIANINNPYKRPYSNLVWRMDYSRQTVADGTTIASSAKRTELITNPSLAANSISAYRVRYLQLPPAIVVNEFNPENQKHCVLDIILHDLIVDEAVKIAKASVKPNEYQIAAAEKNEGDD